jgi:hypothetical protein
MEDVLEVYHRPYDPTQPVVCMDEQPVQLIKEICQPLPAVSGRAECVDYEYERNGTANIFLFTEPLAGWRRTSIRERKTAIDWAEEIHRLLEQDYPEAPTVVLVCDNLNTHKIASLYAVFVKIDVTSSYSVCNSSSGWSMTSAAGLRQTSVTGSQFRVSPLQRWGWRALACS